MESVSNEVTPSNLCSDERNELLTVLNQQIKLETIAAEFFLKLRDLGMDHLEKRLGAGAAGTVVQLKGQGEYHNTPLALKVFEYSKERVFSSSNPKGEVLALSLPENSYLGNAMGVFTFDGAHVNFERTHRPNVLNGQIVMGVLSKAIPGQTLTTMFNCNQTFSKNEIQQIGKQIAVAIRNLHAAGYTHKDIHGENILVEKGRMGITAHLIDFGIACPISEKRARTDWKKFGYLLAEMGGTELLSDPQFFDFLYSEKRGLLNGKKPYSGSEIETHPFFRGL